MLKKLVVAGALALGLNFAAAPEADAGIVYRRVAPVRRVLPPYGGRVVYGPAIVRPAVVRPAVVAPVYGPVVYGPTYATPVYGGGVSVSVGW